MTRMAGKALVACGVTLALAWGVGAGPAMAQTVSTNFSGSSVSIKIGTMFKPENCVKRAAFPSMTGRAATGPILPNPKTRLPLVQMATVFPMPVNSRAVAGSDWIILEMAATPGV